MKANWAGEGDILLLARQCSHIPLLIPTDYLRSHQGFILFICIGKDHRTRITGIFNVLRFSNLCRPNRIGRSRFRSIGSSSTHRRHRIRPASVSVSIDRDPLAWRGNPKGSPSSNTFRCTEELMEYRSSTRYSRSQESVPWGPQSQNLQG